MPSINVPALRGLRIFTTDNIPEVCRPQKAKAQEHLAKEEQLPAWTDVRLCSAVCMGQQQHTFGGGGGAGGVSSRSFLLSARLTQT